MLVDLFTFNKKIKQILEKQGFSSTEDSNLEGTCYGFLKLPKESIPFPEINRLVATNDFPDLLTTASQKEIHDYLSQYGGYEIRNSKTGDFVEILKSQVETLATSNHREN